MKAAGDRSSAQIKNSLSEQGMRSDALTTFKVAIVDADAHTRERLQSGLQQAGFPQTQTSASLKSDADFDVVVFNLHAAQTDAESQLRACKHHSPHTLIILLCTPGPMQRAVAVWLHEQWVDFILTKPLVPGALREKVQQACALLRERRLLAAENYRFSSNLTDDAVRAIRTHETASRIEERAVLFTDVRGSTALVETLSAPLFFESLNTCLAEQSVRVRENGGELIKFTGDGLMATFAGFGYIHRALRCAVQLQDRERQALQEQRKIHFGIGLAEGIVMCGFVGDAVRRQYDVLGANVHLAARLCSHAEAGQIVLTEKMWQRAALKMPRTRALGALEVKGFTQAVACRALD